MPQTKGYGVKGKRVILRESRHCIHSKKVKDKQGNPEIKRIQTMHNRNTDCLAVMNLKLECRNTFTNYPLEVNLIFKHNHVINSAESLSFRRVHEKTHAKYMQLFYDGHSPATALYTYQDELHISILSNEELIETLADCSLNPDYNYVKNLFNHYRDSQLGKKNGMPMFQRLNEEVINLMPPAVVKQFFRSMIPKLERHLYFVLLQD